MSLDEWRQLDASRYFVLAERLASYEGAVRGALMREVREEQERVAATAPPAPLDPTQQQHPHDPAPVMTTPIASDRLPTYSGEALAQMTDDGGMGFPGIEYDGG